MKAKEAKAEVVVPGFDVHSRCRTRAIYLFHSEAPVKGKDLCGGRVDDLPAGTAVEIVRFEKRPQGLAPRRALVQTRDNWYTWIELRLLRKVEGES